MASVERSHAFVVKIWEEDRGGAGLTCRGSVEDVQTRDRSYFSTLAELCALLARQTGMPPPPGPSRRVGHFRVGGRTDAGSAPR